MLDTNSPLLTFKSTFFRAWTGPSLVTNVRSRFETFITSDCTTKTFYKTYIPAGIFKGSLSIRRGEFSIFHLLRAECAEGNAGLGINLPLPGCG